MARTTCVGEARGVGGEEENGDAEGDEPDVDEGISCSLRNLPNARARSSVSDSARGTRGGSRRLQRGLMGKPVRRKATMCLHWRMTVIMSCSKK